MKLEKDVVLKLALFAAAIVASGNGQSSSSSRNCGQPGPIANGMVTLRGGTGGRARYACSPGYVLVGQSRRRCKGNSRWSGRAPLCVASSAAGRDCGLPNPINNGAVVVRRNITVVGGRATYSCNPGFVLEGAKKRVCKKNGKWSKTPPLCKATCPPLEDIPNGSIEATGNSTGDSATYRCADSHTMQGEAVRTCQDNGTWSGNEPQCSRTQCYRLFLISGQVRIAGTGVGASAYHTCDRGYNLVGSSIRTCQPDGNWNGVTPHCRRIRCPFLRVNNGWASQGTSTVDSVASYNCFSGYTLVGPATRTCGTDGRWTQPEPECKKNCVRLPTNFLQGSFSVTGDYFPGTRISFRCNSGYRLNGSAVLVCQRDGTWSGRYPYCTDACGILRLLGGCR